MTKEGTPTIPKIVSNSFKPKKKILNNEIYI